MKIWCVRKIHTFHILLAIWKYFLAEFSFNAHLYDSLCDGCKRFLPNGLNTGNS